MKRTLLAASLYLLIGTAAFAEPATSSVPDIRAYTDAMRDTLGQIGVDVRRIDSPRDELLVVYSLDDDAPLPEFAVAAVLRLVEPLAGGAERIRLRNVRGGDTLLEAQVRPEQIETVLASTVNAAQRDEIRDLLEEAMAASGVVEVRVPAAQTADAPRPPARILQHGDVPVDQSDISAQFAPRQTSPAETFGPQPADRQPSGPEVRPGDEQAVADALFERLREADLENISIARDAGGMWIISFENRTWRTDIDALARALEAAADTLPPMAVGVQIKRHDVVVSHLAVELADFVKLQSGILSAATLTERWRVAPGPAEATAPIEVLARGNSSHLRTDLLMRPAIDYTIGLEHDPFESDYYLITDARTTLAPGLWANLRFPARLTSGRRVAMDRGLLGWVGRPVDGILATASAGRFEEQLHGFYGEARTDTGEHQFGIVGSLTERDFQLDPGDAYASAFGYYQYDWGDIGLKARLGYGQLLESGDDGAALSLRRRYGESVVEARAIRSDEGDEGLTFGLSVPLGPRRASSPETMRLRSDTAFTIDYVSDFNARGDYLQGPHDLESFRGEVSPAYVRAHPERLSDGSSGRAGERWPVAPSYEGTSGLIRIPTADVAPDGHLFAGISYFDRDHSKVVGDNTDAMPTFLGIGFLPNLELVGRLTFFHDVTAFNWNYNLDRSLNLHYRINRQRGEWFPAFAVGAQDVMFGTPVSYLGEGEYLVGTLQRDRMRAHIGLGSGKFDPLFGGLEMSIAGENRVHAMAEYDSDYVNAGLRWFVDDWGTASLSLLGMKNITGSLTFHTDLP